MNNVFLQLWEPLLRFLRKILELLASSLVRQPSSAIVCTRRKRIILVRHGQSLGNVDETEYARTPDWKMPLTPLGCEQARDAGQKIAELCHGESVLCYVSPYHRTMDTWHLIKDELAKDPSIRLIGCRQEVRVAEQQFGNFQNPQAVLRAKEQRRDFGRFFYRFPNGESGLDVYSRVTSFLATLSRDFKQLGQRDVAMNDCNILIVTHGLTLRLFLTRYFVLSVEEFEETINPPNAEPIIMNRHRSDEYGWEYYRLDAKSAAMLNLNFDVSTESPVFWRERYNL